MLNERQNKILEIIGSANGAQAASLEFGTQDFDSSESGILIADILNKLNEDSQKAISKRTVNRDIKKLIELNHICSSGQGKATRYQISTIKKMFQEITSDVQAQTNNPDPNIIASDHVYTLEEDDIPASPKPNNFNEGQNPQSGFNENYQTQNDPHQQANAEDLQQINKLLADTLEKERKENEALRTNSDAPDFNPNETLGLDSSDSLMDMFIERQKESLAKNLTENISEYNRSLGSTRHKDLGLDPELAAHTETKKIEREVINENPHVSNEQNLNENPEYNLSPTDVAAETEIQTKTADAGTSYVMNTQEKVTVQARRDVPVAPDPEVDTSLDSFYTAGKPIDEDEVQFLIEFNVGIFDVLAKIQDKFFNEEEIDILESSIVSFKKQRLEGITEAEVFESKMNKLKANYSWKSSYFEGIHLDLSETRRLLLQDESKIVTRYRGDLTLIKKHMKVMDFIQSKPHEFKVLSLDKILKLYSFFADEIEFNPMVRTTAGNKSRKVFKLANSEEQIYDTLSKSCQFINSCTYAMEKAFFAWALISYIRGFKEYNDCLARTVLNAVMHSYYGPTVSFMHIEQDMYQYGKDLITKEFDLSYFKELFMESVSKSFNFID